MSFVIKKDKKKRDKAKDIELVEEADQGPKECKDPSQKYSKKCSINGKLLQNENENRKF